MSAAPTSTAHTTQSSTASTGVRRSRPGIVYTSAAANRSDAVSRCLRSNSEFNQFSQCCPIRLPTHAPWHAPGAVRCAGRAPVSVTPSRYHGHGRRSRPIAGRHATRQWRERGAWRHPSLRGRRRDRPGDRRRRPTSLERDGRRPGRWAGAVANSTNSVAAPAGGDYEQRGGHWGGARDPEHRQPLRLIDLAAGAMAAPR